MAKIAPPRVRVRSGKFRFRSAGCKPRFGWSQHPTKGRQLSFFASAPHPAPLRSGPPPSSGVPREKPDRGAFRWLSDHRSFRSAPLPLEKRNQRKTRGRRRSFCALSLPDWERAGGAIFALRYGDNRAVRVRVRSGIPLPVRGLQTVGVGWSILQKVATELFASAPHPAPLRSGAPPSRGAGGGQPAPGPEAPTPPDPRNPPDHAFISRRLQPRYRLP